LRLNEAPRTEENPFSWMAGVCGKPSNSPTYATFVSVNDPIIHNEAENDGVAKTTMYSITGGNF
jgi:hypothetical protein